jgi:LacI family transcriptional regulator
MRKRPHVALLIETSQAYGRELLRGISHYVQTHYPWSIYVRERSLDDPLPRWLQSWEGDGVITRIKDEPVARQLLSLGIPVVDVRYQAPDLALPAIYSDQHETGRLAAQHFLERGFRSFAYYGPERHNWSEARGEHYAAELARAGYQCLPAPHFLKDGEVVPWEERLALLAGWLRELPKPVAIFASRDTRGAELIDACRREGLGVPEQVAVLGVDNDAILCELIDPPLSSVDPNVKRLGYEAAALLDHLMSGNPPPEQPVYIPPLGISVRQSTAITAIEDPDVAAACRFIRENACNRIDVAQVVAQTALSRRALERRFQRWLERSPKAEIHRVQIQRVKQLLIQTDHRLAEIAALAGFQHVEYMSYLFKKKTGQTPGQFRRLREQDGSSFASVEHPCA